MLIGKMTNFYFLYIVGLQLQTKVLPLHSQIQKEICKRVWKDSKAKR